MSLLRSGAYAEHLEKTSFVGNAIRGGIGDLVVGAAKGALNLRR